MCESFNLGPDFGIKKKGDQQNYVEINPEQQAAADAAKTGFELSFGLSGTKVPENYVEKDPKMVDPKPSNKGLAVEKQNPQPIRTVTGPGVTTIKNPDGSTEIEIDCAKFDPKFQMVYEKGTKITLVNDDRSAFRKAFDWATGKYYQYTTAVNQAGAKVGLPRLGTGLAEIGGTVAAGVGLSAAAPVVANGVAAAAGALGTKGAAIAGGAAILAACQKEAIPELPEAKNTNTNAGASVTVTMSDIVEFLYNSVKGVKLSTGDKTADGKDIPVQFVVNGAGNRLEDIDLKIGSLTLDIAFTEEEVTYADGTKGPAYVGKPDKAIEAGQVVQYITTDLAKNGAPVNGDGKDYDFGTNVKTPVITFTAKDDKGNVKLDAEGKPITVSVPIDNNEPISLETMKEYITKILDKSFPEGAEFALGKKDGKDGVIVTWNEVVGMSEAEIIEKFKNEHPNLPQGATFSFENGKVVVHYDVTTTLPDNEVIDNFKNEHKNEFPQDAKYELKDGKITVKYTVETDLAQSEIIARFLEEHPDVSADQISYKNGVVTVTYNKDVPKTEAEIKADFLKDHPDVKPEQISYKDGVITVKYDKDVPLSEKEILDNFKAGHAADIPAGAEVTYDGNGKVTVKWKLTDKEVVEKLNIDPNKKANYSIDANGNIIETFKVDGQDYTHQYGKTPKLDEKAQADFKPIADFLGLDKGIVLDFKTGDSSWDGSASWSRSLSIGLTGKDIDNAEYRVLMDGHEAKGKPEKQADGSVKIGNATFKLGERVVDNDGEELRFPSMEVSIDGRKYVLHYDDFGGDVGRGINQVEEDGQEVFFPEKGKKTITFDTVGADKDYREYDRNQSKDFDVDTTKPGSETKNYDVDTTKPGTETKDYNVPTTEKEDKEEGPFDVDTTKTEHKADPYDVDGVKTEPREEFIEDKLTENRDDAKKYYDEKKEHLDKVYQEAAAKLKIAPAAVAEAKARITNQ